MNNAYPTRNELIEYLQGRLDLDRSEQLDAHIPNCRTCLTELDTLSDTADSFLARLRNSQANVDFIDEPECLSMLQRIAPAASERLMAKIDRLQVNLATKNELGEVGPYLLQSKLGSGGMGTVFKALHPKLKRTVAIKMLPLDRMQDPEAISRFEREMQAVGRLDHPRIVRASDAGEHEGKHYLVMEYISGADLSSLAKQVGSFSVQDSCEIARQAAFGLHHAHSNGLVHRDIKPSNIMLTFDGGVKILDLGLALLPIDVEEQSELTSAGQAMGTLDYMSPEQATDSHDVDVRSDIYSLGATLYRLLAGATIYSGPGYQSMMDKWRALATEPAPPLQSRRANVPDELANLVHRMIARKREDRFDTCSEVAEALLPFCERADLAALAHASPPSKNLATESTSHSTMSVRKQSASIDTDARPQPSLVNFEIDETRLTTPRAKQSRSPLWYIVPLTIAAAVGGVLFALAIVMIFRTSQGRIVVRIPDGVDADHIQVVAKQGGKIVEVVDAKGGWNIQLQEGVYNVELLGGDDQIKLDKKSVTVERNRRTLVAITFRPKPAGADKPLQFGENFGDDAPQPAIAPFDSAEARKAQAEWAKYLNLPVRHIVELPGGEQLTMLLVPPGQFTMGSPEDETKAWRFNAGEFNLKNFASERPSHLVRITRPFFLAEFETTQSQWSSLIEKNPSANRGKDNPVENTSWNDAQDFISKLNNHTKDGRLQFQLPTEAQWEFACRAGTETPWWYAETEEAAIKFRGKTDKTYSASEFKPNPFGFLAMHDNVFEHCADFFSYDFYARSKAVNPINNEREHARTYRGGCYFVNPRFSRSAARNSSTPTNALNTFGFRLAAQIRDDALNTPSTSTSPWEPATSDGKLWPKRLPLEVDSEEYDAFELGPFAANEKVAAVAALSEDGWIYGNVSIKGNPQRPFRYNVAAKGPVERFRDVWEIADVNYKEVLVGHQRDPKGDSRTLVVWDGNQLTPLPKPSGIDSTIAATITDSGFILARCSNNLFYIWDGKAWKNKPGWEVSDINNQGALARTVRDSEGQLAAEILLPDGKTIRAPFEKDAVVYAGNINDQNLAIAAARTSKGEPSLGMLFGDGVSHLLTLHEVSDLNQSGDIVVGAVAPKFGLGKAALWRDGETVMLHPDGWRRSRLECINEKGIIVGDGNRPDGTIGSFVLIPK